MSFFKKIELNSLFALFAFLMPIHEKASTILIFVCLLVLIIEIAKKKVYIEWRKELLVLPILYVLYVGISALLSDKIEFKWFEQKASLLIFPFLFSTSYKFDYKKILKAFVYGCLIAYIICVVFAIKNSLIIESGNIVFNPLLNESRGFGFFKSMVYEGNYFFGTHFSLLIQISYFALYLTFGLIVLLFYLEDFKGKKIIISILILGVLQTISLAGILNLIILFFLLLRYKVKSLKKRSIYGFGFLLIVILSAVYHPRISISIKSFYETTVQGENSVDFPKLPRLSVWEGALKVIKEHQFGLGIPKAQEELNKMYDEIGFKRNNNKVLNAHNQYFQIVLECGLLGLGVLLYLFYLLYNKTKNLVDKEKIIIHSFLLLIIINFLFESMLNRYIGVSFFVFFTYLFFNLKRTKLGQI